MTLAARWLAPYLAYPYLSLVGLTSRIRWAGLEHLKRLERGGSGFIYAFWHQRQALFTCTHREAGIHALVSRSKDGEIIARTMRLSRIAAVRGSSSRGATHAARELLEILRGGGIVALTPDGPRGPARQVKLGALFLAVKSGCPILPITNAVSRKLELAKAWDRFQIPLPFSRICVHHGAPMHIAQDDDLDYRAAQLKAELDRITAEADRMVE